MWNTVTHILSFALGTMTGVTLMCLLQAGKQADKQLDDMEGGKGE